MYTYLVAQNDELALPLGVFDTLPDVCRFIGFTPQWVCKRLSDGLFQLGNYLVFRFVTKELFK